jgi:CubicO group peptidase (beta-lactamase class C family)
MKRSHAVAVAFFICLPAGSAAPASPQEIEARIARVTAGLLADTGFEGRYAAPARLQDRMAHYHTPGVSVAVVNEGRVEWARGFGRRDTGERAALNERTLFQAGSISKPIFALAVMRLAEEGRLKLDEDVNGYLKSWKVPTNGSWPPRVTLRQLLSHSAGLTVHGFPGYAAGERIPTVVDVLRGVPPANTAPVFVNIVPGVQFRYSGGGTTVAQLVLTDVLGQNFPAAMKTLVFDRLAMSDSTYEQPLPAHRARQAATAHPWKGKPLEGRFHVYPEMAAAGLWTTAADLARAGIALQRAVSGSEGVLLSRPTAEEMLVPSPAGGGVGLGFFLEGEGESTRFGHDGWDEGFVAAMTFYRSRGQGAVVMVNSNEGHPLLREIMRAVAKEYAWPGYFPEPPPSTVLAAATLDALTGTFASKKLELRVTLENDALYLVVGEQPPLLLRPRSVTAFRAEAVDAEVAFEIKDGKAQVLSLRQGGSSLVFERK